MALWQQLAPFAVLPFLMLAGWLTRALPTAVYYPAAPLRFKVKKSVPPDEKSPKKSTKTELVNIRQFLETKVPSLYKKYRPTWWLFNGHAQTGYLVAGDFTKVDQLVYERTLIRLPDGGTLGVDVTPPGPELAPETPIIVVQHGLTGGSYESYVRSVLSAACMSKSEGGLGFRGIVINCRGCANVPVTSPQFYSGAPTDDLRCGLLYISHKYPNAPLVGLGFSLGANILTRYLGEEGDRSRLDAGLALACPWDVEKNMHRLDTDFISRHLYSKALGANLINLFKHHLETLRSFPPDDRMTPIIEPVLALKNPTFLEVDAIITRTVGGPRPTFPLPTALAYWQHASSHKHPHKIRVPFLAINAADDPIVAHNPTDETEHSTTCALAVTPYGGHLGWFTGGGFLTGLFGRGVPPDRWVRAPALEFLRACAEDFVRDEGHGMEKGGRDRVVRDDGFVLEKGKEGIVGFKVVEEGIIIRGAEDTTADDLIAGL